MEEGWGETGEVNEEKGLDVEGWAGEGEGEDEEEEVAKAGRAEIGEGGEEQPGEGGVEGGKGFEGDVEDLQSGEVEEVEEAGHKGGEINGGFVKVVLAKKDVFGKEVDAQGTEREHEEGVEVAKEGKGEEKMGKVEKEMAGEIGGFGHAGE